jgi:hypothetical protein
MIALKLFPFLNHKYVETQGNTVYKCAFHANLKHDKLTTMHAKYEHSARSGGRGVK